MKELDPSRPVNQASGGRHVGAGDVFDIHSYPAPASPNSTTKAKVVGEYGGIGYKIEDHLWQDGFGYVLVENDEEYHNLYNRFANQLTLYKTNNGLSAAVYTQTTDVETELNGLMTYDRAVVKGDPEVIRESNRKVINRELYLTELLPSSQNEGRNWTYTYAKPAYSNWYELNYDTSGWQTGEAGFGTQGTPGAVVRTTWNSSDIWMRQEFTLEELPDDIREDLVLNIHHDEASEIYINGVKAAEIESYTTDYTIVSINDAAKKALNSNGRNVIAVHCNQTAGGQYIDAGLSVMSFGEPVDVGKATSFNPPEKNKLHQNYPNPFDPSVQSTKFCIDLKQDGHVKLTVYDVLGRKVKVLVDQFLEAQSCYTTVFKGRDLGSGVYFAQLETTQGVQSIPLTLVN